MAEPPAHSISPSHGPNACGFAYEPAESESHDQPSGTVRAARPQTAAGGMLARAGCAGRRGVSIRPRAWRGCGGAPGRRARPPGRSARSTRRVGDDLTKTTDRKSTRYARIRIKGGCGRVCAREPQDAGARVSDPGRCARSSTGCALERPGGSRLFARSGLFDLPLTSQVTRAAETRFRLPGATRSGADTFWAGTVLGARRPDATQSTMAPERS